MDSLPFSLKYGAPRSRALRFNIMSRIFVVIVAQNSNTNKKYTNRLRTKTKQSKTKKEQVKNKFLKYDFK